MRQIFVDNVRWLLLCMCVLLGCVPLSPAFAQSDLPTLTIADVTRTEGNVGYTSMKFDVRLSKAASTPVVFDIFAVQASAYYTADFLFKSESAARIEPGQTSYSFVVSLVADTIPEYEEFFWVNVVNVTGATVGDGGAKGTIIDDDASGEPTISIDDVTVVEGNSGISTATVTASLSHPWNLGVHFYIETFDLTALDGQDYEHRVGAQSIPAGSTTFTFDVWVDGDRLSENDESIGVRIYDVSNATLGRGEAVVRIINDDGPPPVVPVDDFYAFEQGVPLHIEAAIGILDNDQNNSGQQLAAKLLESRLPKYGSVVLEPNGAFTYSPSAGTGGEDSFAYEACAGGNCSVAIVKLASAKPLSELDRYVWYWPSARNAEQQGFIRIINRTSYSDSVSVWGIDANGRRSSGTLKTVLGPWQSLQFTSQDAEIGNEAKGLTGGLGSGDGNWTLVVRSGLKPDVLAYIRTPDGFVTPVHDRVVGDGVDWHVPMFNPARNVSQVSWLRIVNTSLQPADVLISGIDDQAVASSGQVTMTVRPHAAIDLSSTDLESGNPAKGLTGALGGGSGKWRLRVSADERISVQSLLLDPQGYVTNLSTLAGSGSAVSLWHVPSAATVGQQGFLRISSLSSGDGTVSIWGVDDEGHRSSGTARLALRRGQSVQLNSQDLEYGNLEKSLSGKIGSGVGDWRLFLSGDVEFQTMAMMRTDDGFLTSLHDVADAEGTSWHVPTFNPASNPNQVSRLRVINPSDKAVHVEIVGTDDTGGRPPESKVSFVLGAGQVLVLSASDLESGATHKGVQGALGVGNGKWQLLVSADGMLQVQSLLEDPNGYLTNLSKGTTGRATALDP